MAVSSASESIAPGVVRYAQSRPWASNEEQLESLALAVADIPGAELQVNVRPPLDQIQSFPNRFGYGDAAERTLTITDVINVNDRYNKYDYSGRTSGYQGSSYPSMNVY